MSTEYAIAIFIGFLILAIIRAFYEQEKKLNRIGERFSQLEERIEEKFSQLEERIEELSGDINDQYENQ